MKFLATGFVCAILLVVAGGCSGSAGGVTVTGTVTYDGKPVPQGHVSLAPADGKGAVVGGEIRNGQFSIANVPPGEKIVSVAGGEQPRGPISSEEMAQMAARGEKPPEVWTIPPNAKGNNQRVTISGPGPQTLKIELSAP